MKEIVPYISSLIKHDDIELSIKVRPMIEDIYFEELKNELPLSKKLNVFDGRIEDIANDFDIFMGSNSTAVIEGSLFGKISILLKTKKFGDYFGMDELISQKSLLVKQPEKIYESIIYRVDNENSLRTIEITRDKFFGENKDGVQWILEQL